MLAYNDNAEDQITGWASNKYGVQSSNQANGLLDSGSSIVTSAPAASTWGAAASPTAAAPISTAPAQSTWAAVAAPVARSATSGGQVRPAESSVIPDPPAWVSPNLQPTQAQNVGTLNLIPASTSNVIPGADAKPVTIDPASLAVRTIDPGTETVSGRVNTLLAENSPVLQQAQAQAMRSAADRGMLNSAMAASAGTNAAIAQATNIATPDAAAYNAASNYNVAATNQALMQNTTNAQALQQTQLQLQDSAASRANQVALANLQTSLAKYQADLSASTSRYQSDQSAATSKYNTDTSYQQQMAAQKESLVNQIINNMDLSPDRKAAMLQSLGEGTMASGSNPGTGLAGAVYVIGSVAADLGGTSSSSSTSSSTGSAAGVNGGIPSSGASSGTMGSLMTRAATNARQMAQ